MAGFLAELAVDLPSTALQTMDQLAPESNTEGLSQGQKTFMDVVGFIIPGLNLMFGKPYTHHATAAEIAAYVKRKAYEESRKRRFLDYTVGRTKLKNGYHDVATVSAKAPDITTVVNPVSNIPLSSQFNRETIDESRAASDQQTLVAQLASQVAQSKSLAGVQQSYYTALQTQAAQQTAAQSQVVQNIMAQRAAAAAATTAAAAAPQSPRQLPKILGINGMPITPVGGFRRKRCQKIFSGPII